MLPTEGSMPASASRSVYLIERYWADSSGCRNTMTKEVCDDHSKAAIGSICQGAIAVPRATASGRTRRAATVLGSHRGRHGAEAVRDAITRTIVTLPEQLRRSLTWDQGAEMAQHARLKIDAGVRVYFCDPHSPWQRGTNENTNGLLRQYFPKGTDLSIHSADEIASVATALNSRPRKPLDWKTPAEALNELLRSANKQPIATTG